MKSKVWEVRVLKRETVRLRFDGERTAEEVQHALLYNGSYDVLDAKDAVNLEVGPPMAIACPGHREAL